MFWVSLEAISNLEAVPDHWFELEDPRVVDGRIEHAVERSFIVAVEESGGTVGIVGGNFPVTPYFLS
jgi:hypothetical protein